MPIATHFPVRVPSGFVLEGKLAFNAAGKPCAAQLPPYTPRWGGGFRAPRGPKQLAHRALDIIAAEGSHVVAPSRVRVRAVEFTPKGGHCLYLDSYDEPTVHLDSIARPTGFRWYFAHLRDAPRVLAGDMLIGGEFIGYVGRTGNATARQRRGGEVVIVGCPHLHLSLTAVTSSAQREARRLGLDVMGNKVDAGPLLEPFYPPEVL